jgi:arylamine N-acetyltransferase
LTPAYSSDIDVANHFQASAPTSHFRHHLFVGRFTAKGRDGLFDNQLTRRTGANTEVQLIQSIEEMCSVLKNVFNIEPIGFENFLEVIIKRET